MVFWGIIRWSLLARVKRSHSLEILVINNISMKHHKLLEWNNLPKLFQSKFLHIYWISGPPAAFLYCDKAFWPQQQVSLFSSVLFHLWGPSLIFFFSMACLTFSLSSLGERIFESLPYVSADCPGFQFSCRFHGSIWTSPWHEPRWLTDLGGAPQVRRIQSFRMVGIVGTATFSFVGSNPLVN